MVDEEYCVMLMLVNKMAMVAEKEEEMDKMLDRVHEYTKKWRFRCNEKKSMVTVITGRQKRRNKVGGWETRRWTRLKSRNT